MAEQQFCLRWNNFQANIVTSFENLLDREEFVDVTLTAEGKSLKAHRVLLSACSPYFRDLFRDLPAHQHPVIVLRDTSFLELKSLLSFIYHGEVNVSQERLGLLLKTAEALRIKGLAQEKNSEFGSLSSSPEKEPEEGLDRGERRGGGPGSPSLPQAFAGISGSVLAPVNPLVPLDPPSHKPPHVLHSPPPKRRKPLHSPLGGPPVPIPTPPVQRENSLPQAAPVTSTASHEEDATSKVINLTMGTTESSAGSPSPRVIPKLEEEDGPGRGNSSLGGIGIGIGGIGDVGSDQEEEPIKAEDGDDDLSSSTTPDLHGLPQHLNFVPYAAAAAAAAAGSSQLDTFPGPSGVLPPASQAGWRGGHSEPSDTQAQGGSTMLALESLVGSLGGSGDENDGEIPNSGAVNSGTTSQNNILEDPLGTHDSGDAADLWAINTCSSSVLAASDFTNPLLTNHHLLPTVSLHQVTTAKAKGSGTVSCTSPSRQSCSCPLCGRHIAQRRSLKQHLMSNFHRLSPCKADSVVREYLAVVTR